MKIQTRLTGFFIIMLAVFSYVLVWISTRAYRREVNRLNYEVAIQRLDQMLKIITEQDNLFLEHVYQTEADAQDKALERIRDSIRIRARSDAGFPIIVTAKSKILLGPKSSKITRLPGHQKLKFSDYFRKKQGEIHYQTGPVSRIILYRTFQPWGWIMCYSFPMEASFYSSVSKGYFRQILAVICCMVASVAALLWLIQHALSPLNRLVSNATGMAAGIFPDNKDRRDYSHDEIGILNKAFDEMADRIQESMAKLQEEIKERREKEHEIRELIENSPMPIATVSKDKSFSVNEMFSKVFGFNEKEMRCIDDFFEMSRPDSTPARKNTLNWQKMLQEKTPGIAIKRLKCKNGKVLEIEVRHKRIKKQSLLMFNDLTEIKEAEKRLRNTRNYLNQLFDSIRQQLIAVNDRGYVTQWNMAMEKFTGIKSQDAVGFKLWVLARFLSTYRNEVEQVIASGKPREKYRETIIWQKRKYFFNICINPFNNSENRGAVITMEDVTELARKSEQLIQTQKMETVGTLTGGLAHDFNNVLGGIKGSLSMIRYYLNNAPDESEEINEFAALAEQSVNRAASMVEQLLALSRKSQLSFKPVDLNESFSHVLSICRGTFDKSVTISISKPPGKIMVEADGVQIDQVLLNMLINAEHSMTIMRGEDAPKGGDIEISISRTKLDPLQYPKAIDQEEFWQVDIKDNGVGIPPDTMRKIFDPFFTTKARGKGTGLGLAMVYNIIDMHNGFVDVKSEPGTGSIFTVYLPELLPGEESYDVHQVNSEIIPGSGLVLIIDDELAIRATAGKMLESLGYRVLTAENGEEGVEIFRNYVNEVDVVLLDIAMPVMSGDEAFKRIREIRSDTAVLVSSGFTNDSRVQKTLEAGAKGFIKKPYSLNKLSRKLHEVISRRS
ncbi:response regulator [Lentisphaerota bacterium ZTH]|nr:response regulator [Lentisphaerota bacterium]WET06047.1 response regulator [Lentisphaerota bacterium ZTH]